MPVRKHWATLVWPNYICNTVHSITAPNYYCTDAAIYKQD